MDNDALKTFNNTSTSIIAVKENPEKINAQKITPFLADAYRVRERDDLLGVVAKEKDLSP